MTISRIFCASLLLALLAIIAAADIAKPKLTDKMSSGPGRLVGHDFFGSVWVEGKRSGEPQSTVDSATTDSPPKLRSSARRLKVRSQGRASSRIRRPLVAGNAVEAPVGRTVARDCSPVCSPDSRARLRPSRRDMLLPGQEWRKALPSDSSLNSRREDMPMPRDTGAVGVQKRTVALRRHRGYGLVERWTSEMGTISWR